ncbi:MAG TPA: long-chain-fatty-acid--CoA ligase [Acidobacteriota bacterium]|nr:long-chain-fatty-acid--CoA ligase [Acidobacteriota bacterium]
MINHTTADQCRNLPELVYFHTCRQPDKTFLISETDGRTFTYAEFTASIHRTARLLASHGIQKGDVVSLLMPNSVEYVIAYFACFQLGALAGPVNSLLKAHELTYVIGNSEARAILVNSQFESVIDDIKHDLPALKSIIRFDLESDATADLQVADCPEPEIDREDEAIIIYTSGTTGKPKGCLLTHGNLLANARQIKNWLGFTESDRLLTIMPLFHMNAVSVTTVTPLFAGGSSVVSPKFSATKFWHIISDYQITSFGSVATMLSMLLKTYPAGIPPELKTAQIRFGLCGSAPVPAEVMRQFEERFGFLIIEGYGLSESTCRSTFNPPDPRRRPGSCGMPIGNEMKVVDEDDQDVPDGEAGEIVMRGENIFKAYFKNPEATAIAFRNGWFHTGDVGYRDSDGFYFIVDRKSDMIIRGGENIYPREIDEVLYAHPAVAAGAAVGMPDPLYGEDVAAFIVLKDGCHATEEDILRFCREELADYKCPKVVYFVADFPKGPTGKVLKRELAKQLKQMKNE